MKFLTFWLLFLTSFTTVLATEIPMVVIIPSYNNEQWCERNLLSVLSQCYENYRVIYINDCSTDRTGELVATYVNNHPQGWRVTILNNSKRCGALSNLFHAIHSCLDAEVIVTVDGDDWLAFDGVLSLLNSVYADGTVWMTYGELRTWPNGTRGEGRAISADIIEVNAYRYSHWMTSHLRTFYAGLFKKIQKEDLLYEGSFFEGAWDLAIMFPMLEMAGVHSRYIADILYELNLANPIRGDAALSRKMGQIIRKRKQYARLQELHLS